jgi:hypothetical protein
MTRTPKRFALVVLMLCLIAAWAGFMLTKKEPRPHIA